MERNERTNKNELEKEFKDLLRKLILIRGEDKEIQPSYDLEDFTIKQLKNRKAELYQNLSARYSRSEDLEYNEICQKLGEKNKYETLYDKMFHSIEPNFTADTEIYIRLLCNTLKYKRWVYQDLEEAYEFLKVDIISKLIPLLKKEASKNQDAVNVAIDYIEVCYKEYYYK